MTEAKKLKKYKVRTCRTRHSCELCPQPIVYGEKYHDGGYGKRAHTDCVEYVIIMES